MIRHCAIDPDSMNLRASLANANHEVIYCSPIVHLGFSFNFFILHFIIEELKTNLLIYTIFYPVDACLCSKVYVLIMFKIERKYG